MLIIAGVILLIAAAVIAVAGALSNGGQSNAVDFSALGYHITGTSGSLFLSGIGIGAAAMLGLALLLAGLSRHSRRLRDTRDELALTRRAAKALRKDHARLQRETADAPEPLKLRAPAWARRFGSRPAAKPDTNLSSAET